MLTIQINLERHLHIVSLDIPWPADYGGVIDIFNKISALHKIGIRIYLHCFEYGRSRQAVLEKYCAEVHYYKRRYPVQSISATRPYIVLSRKNEELAQNLLKNDYPILLEGIHCTAFFDDKRFQNRKFLLRLHNVEYRYYRNLYRSENSWFPRWYFFAESVLLYYYEKKLAKKARIAAISESDLNHYRSRFKAKDIHYIPALLPFEKVNSKLGRGEYCLYHGNLAVNENEEVALYLITKLVPALSVPLIIAGKNPSERLIRMAEGKSGLTLIPNPDDAQLLDLIRNAQVNILLSVITTGIKLKILNALFNGRHCLINKKENIDHPAAELCHHIHSPEDLVPAVELLMKTDFTENDIARRKAALENTYDNEKNARLLATLIW